MDLARSSSLVTVLPDAAAFERDDLRFRPLLPAIEERRVVLLQRERLSLGRRKGIRCYARRFRAGARGTTTDIVCTRRLTPAMWESA